MRGVSIYNRKGSGTPSLLLSSALLQGPVSGEAWGFAVDKLFSGWRFIPAPVFYCVVLGGGGVMESRQGWKAGERSAMHRQLQWAQNPRTFTFSKRMTL